MSGAFGMHRVYWAHQKSERVNEDGQRRHVYALRGTHHPSCGWDAAQAVIDEANGSAVFAAVNWNSRTHRVTKTLTVGILPGDEPADILTVIEITLRAQGFDTIEDEVIA